MSDRELAERLVRVAGEIAVALRGGPAGVKGLVTDVVTEADVRAEAAMAVIVAANGEPARFTAEGRADAEPLATNATPEGREENRRIEVVLLRGWN